MKRLLRYVIGEIADDFLLVEEETNVNTMTRGNNQCFLILFMKLQTKQDILGLV